MGTRSLTHFINEQGQDIVTMYRQYDGYIEGHGLDLANFLAPFYMTNGISMGDDRKTANGMGCLAAQVIAEFKDGVGNIYLEPGNTSDAWEEYNYTVYLEKPGPRAQHGMSDTGVIKIKVENIHSGETIFDGTPAELIDQTVNPSTEHCSRCGRDFKHYLHAKNHYTKHHGIAV